MNDDVLFDAAAFDVVGKALSRGLFGVIGPDRSAFAEVSGTPRVTLARASTTSFGFGGVFMCLRRRDYSPPIPESMRIWGGDDWLIMAQRRPPGAILGVRFETEMGSTTQTPEIQKLRAEEQAEADRILTPPGRHTLVGTPGPCRRGGSGWRVTASDSTCPADPRSAPYFRVAPSSLTCDQISAHCLAWRQ